jgi:hypothetical protein
LPIASIFDPHDPQRTEPGGFFANPHEGHATIFPDAIGSSLPEFGQIQRSRGSGFSGTLEDSNCLSLATPEAAP